MSERGLSDLEEFRTWLESRGLRVESTRLHEYITALKAYEVGPPVNELPQADLDRYVFMWREADELRMIFEGLKISEPSGALSLLQKALGGAALSRDETSTAPRNFLYELRIASFFLQAGFTVDLSMEADLTVALSTGTLVVECKRIASANKVFVRAKEACSQLTRRIKAVPRHTTRAFGLACLDISRVLHPNQGVTVTPSADYAKAALQYELRKFDRDFDLAGIFRGNKDIIAVWVQLSAPTLTADGRRTRFSSLHIPLAPQAGPRYEAFEELRKVLELKF